MCGIAGFLDKTGQTTHQSTSVGHTMVRMLEALGCRGPDSTGVAIWNGRGSRAWMLRVKLGETGHFHNGEASQIARDVLQAAERIAPVIDIEVTGVYARLKIAGEANPQVLCAEVENVADEVEVVSCGHDLEIVKQVGSPRELNNEFGVSRWRGTHAIGHTRLSTESRIDLSHSQPFWAHGLPDVATVHNGHITNYHRLRRIYEQRGVRFYTENDSEIIGIYLRDRLSQGDDFETALHASLRDFDGSYCYLAANANTLAFVKDGFGFKPLVLAETDGWVAIATEEIALRSVFGEGFSTVEPPARGLHLWHVPQAVKLER